MQKRRGADDVLVLTDAAGFGAQHLNQRNRATTLNSLITPRGFAGRRELCVVATNDSW